MRAKKTFPSSEKFNAELLLKLNAIQKETTDFILRQAERSMRVTLKAMQQFKRAGNLSSKAGSGEEPDPAYLKEFNLTFISGERYFQSLFKAMIVLSKAGGKRLVNQPLIWSGSNAALIELAYAFKGAAVFNEGHAKIQDIVAFLEQSFHSNLDNHSRTFQEILSRKGGATNFIDKLKTGLQSYIGVLDENHEKRQIRRKA
jgi:hypothetical protein